MRVVQLTSSRFFGSLEWQIVELTRYLPGHVRSTIVSFHEDGLCKSLLDQARRLGLNAVGLRHDTPHLRKASSELTGVLRSTQADLVCCHGYKANLLGRLAARRLGIPAIAIAHGWTGESRRIRLYEALDRRLLRYMDHVVCVSEGQSRKVDQLGVPRDRMSVIHNAVDVGRFVKPQRVFREELEEMFPRRPNRIVGAAGRLSPEKGFDVLIAAAEIVVRHNASIAFVVYGDGPLRDELEASVVEKGLKDRFFFAGFTSRLDKLIPCFDLLTLPSYTEGLPCVVLEALAAGVPVVATAVGGTPEVLIDGAAGYLTPPGDSAALADRIAAVLEDEQQRRSMGTFGRQFVRDKFSFAEQSERYLKLYESLCGRDMSPSRDESPIADALSASAEAVG